jgi:hypothetical protein
VRRVESTPIYGETVDVKPVSGTIRFKAPGSSNFQTLTGTEEIPVGAIIDATNGRVRLTAAKGPDSTQTQTGEFYGGKFKVREPTSGPPVTELALVGFDPSQCAANRSSKLAEASARRRRHRLWGSGRGRFRTRGRRGTASQRGTVWYTEDSCRGTFFKVSKGSVKVRDRTRHRTVIVRAGQQYLAPAP